MAQTQAVSERAADRQPTDVVIVGSGPTGLMAACLLRRCGLSVRILDKSQQQAHESRAFAVHARSMELFLNMGLAEEFLNRGLIATGMQVFVDGENMGGFNFDVCFAARHSLP
jgi:2-polyprenyl-6-methoxyphenol hydroxylase-like FAD-dependent oxidoreductase